MHEVYFSTVAIATVPKNQICGRESYGQGIKLHIQKQDDYSETLHIRNNRACKHPY